MQFVALSGLSNVSEGAECAPLIAQLRLRCIADLEQLGEPVPEGEVDVLRAPHPLALDYVIFGSLLGTAVLRKRWESSFSSKVRAAKNYFGGERNNAPWRAFVARVEGFSADDPTADVVVADAIALFEYYGRCAAIARKEHTEDV